MTISSVPADIPLRRRLVPENETVADTQPTHGISHDRFDDLPARGDRSSAIATVMRCPPVRINGVPESAEAAWQHTLAGLEGRAIAPSDIERCRRAFYRTLSGERGHQMASFSTYEDLVESLVVALNARYGRSYAVAHEAALDPSAPASRGFKDYSLAGKFAFILSFLGALPTTAALPHRRHQAQPVAQEPAWCDVAIPEGMKTYPNVRGAADPQGYDTLVSDPRHVLGKNSILSPGTYLFAWDSATKCLAFARGTRADPAAIFQNPVVHPDLVGGRPVFAAGEFTVNEAHKIDGLGNQSGHLPTPDRLVLAPNCTLGMNLPTLTHVAAQLDRFGLMDPNLVFLPFDEDGEVQRAASRCREGLNAHRHEPPQPVEFPAMDDSAPHNFDQRR